MQQARPGSKPLYDWASIKMGGVRTGDQTQDAGAGELCRVPDLSGLI